MYGSRSNERDKTSRPAVAVTETLHSLCSLYAGKDKVKTAGFYALSLKILSSLVAPSVLSDEFRLSERIQKRLVQQGRERDAVTFMELYQRLCSQQVLKSRGHLLYFLLTLTSDGTTSCRLPSRSGGSLLLDGPGLTSSLEASIRSHTHQHPSATPGPGYLTSSSAASSSGVSSLGSRELSSVLPFSARESSGASIGASSSATPFPQYYSTPALDVHHPPHAHIPHTDTHGRPLLRTAWSEVKPEPGKNHVIKDAHLKSALSSKKRIPSEESEPTEGALLRDLIFVFQNIDGQYLQFDSSQDAYSLTSKVHVSSCMREQCHKLAELGWLHRKVRKFIDSKMRDKSQGLVCQSFCSALTQELTEYYRLIAVLEAQQDQGESSLTLRRLAVWTHDPTERMKMLGVLVDGCKRLKGGALVSTLYAYSQHGDPDVRSLVKHLLNQIYRPINKMLNCWIFDGELIDNSLEFFIACDESSKIEKLWKSKYSIRQKMLPSFISKELAQKILIIGKSINFLRQSCHDHTQLGGSSLRNWFLADDGSCSFDSMTGASLSAVVDASYRETSKYLLQVLHSRYNFTEHLKAFRRYLLLGQGDFIKHLMDLLAPDLSKPASTLYLHNLTGTLEAAIRATNAQYEDADILNRLDVRMLDLSPGDRGWDVFSLHYHVDGPIGTVFTMEATMKYLRVFNFLWRAKRIEYCLANMWREQTAQHRALQTITELRSVLHQCHLLISTMVHFITQLQYYVTFEVMECSWARLVKKVEAAEDLDQVIEAHDSFLEQITTQCLLDPGSQPILTRLRAIFDLVIMFQHKQSGMLSECLKEVERRQAAQEQIKKKTKEGQWGTTSDGEALEEELRRRFVESEVASHRSEFVVLHDSFKDMIQEFMSKLNSHTEQNLRFLCFRLDFNEYYSQLSRTGLAPNLIKL